MKYLKKFICLLMIPVLLLLTACGSVDNPKQDNTAAQQVKYNIPAGLVKKTETVYVNLDNNGAVTQTIVSDWIHTDKAQVYVDDITSLSEIENIKDDSRPDVGANNSLRWYMNTTDLYYQGMSKKTLPVNFEISYMLDGVPAVPSEIIGKSGKVDITIRMHNVDMYDVTINGRPAVMYNPLLVIGGVSLSESKFQNITVKNGRTTGNGNSQVAVLVGFPGINESLGLSSAASSESSSYAFDDTFVISADVTDFELGNLMFAAVPIGSLGLGLNNITNSMGDVRDNIAKLQSIQKSLQSVDANGLLNTLTSNPDKINELSSLVGQASALYDNNKALIDVLNKYATPQNMETIQFLTEYISNADYNGLENALGVINTFFGDEASSAQIQAGIKILREMSNDLKNPQVQSAINNLPKTISTISSLQKAINENKDLIDALKVLSESNVLSSLDGALSGLEGSIAAGSLTGYANIPGNADDLTAKMTAWIELGKRYKIFTLCRDTMDSSVMFVFKVDGLKMNSDKNSADTKVEAEETSGLSSVFKKIFG
ncbi:MAG: hypothetical protein MJ168_00540 [Clostridia bacterium]|nr:hypothetical protein [Clostridia bacterium]